MKRRRDQTSQSSNSFPQHKVSDTWVGSKVPRFEWLVDHGENRFVLKRSETGYQIRKGPFFEQLTLLKKLHRKGGNFRLPQVSYAEQDDETQESLPECYKETDAAIAQLNVILGRTKVTRAELGTYFGLSGGPISLLLRSKIKPSPVVAAKLMRFVYEHDKEFVGEVRSAMSRSQTTLGVLCSLFEPESKQSELEQWMLFDLPLSRRASFDQVLDLWLQKHSKNVQTHTPKRRVKKKIVEDETDDDSEKETKKRNIRKSVLPTREKRVAGPKGKGSHPMLDHEKWRIKWKELKFCDVELNKFVAPGYEILRVGCKGQDLEIKPFSAMQEPTGNPETKSEKQNLQTHKGWLLNVGGSLGTMEWIPVGNSKEEPHLCTQYLALGSNATKYHLMPSHHQGTNMIQIWSFGRLAEPTCVAPFFALGLLHEGALMWDMAWFPLGAYESEKGDPTRLGLLAASFGDGTIKVVSVPHPVQLLKLSSKPPPLFLRIDELPCVHMLFDTILTPIPSLCLAWSPLAPLLAAGTVKATLAIWDLSQFSNSNSSAANTDRNCNRLFPFFYGLAHSKDYPIRCVAFSPLDENKLVTTAQDGFIRMWDLRDLFEPTYSVKTGIEAVLNLVWPKEFGGSFIVTIRNQFRIFLMGTNSKSITFRAMSVIPIADHISPWCLSTHFTPDGLFCTAVALSDGQVNLVSTTAAMTCHTPQKSDISTNSRGLSVTQIEYAVEEAKQAEGTEASPQRKSSPGILFSSGYPMESCISKVSSLVKKRIKLDTRTQTPAQLSLDDWTAILKVKINQNFYFPRWVASGGLSGIVRCQPVTDL